MSSGLWCILDFVDCDSQEDIANLAKKTRSVEEQMSFVDNLINHETNRYTKKIFCFMLSLYAENQFIFKKTNTTKITESDFLSEKYCIYSDVGGGEAARENATGNKIYEDEGKLVREGKDGIDHFLEDTVKVPAEDLVGSILQMKGFSGEFSSVHLNDPLGYGAVPQCKIYIPRDIYALGPFIDSLANLISMVEEMEEMASLLIQAYSFFEDRRSSFGPFVGRASSGNQDRTENYSLWRAGTYYFPKKYIRKISVVPEMTN